MIFDVRNKSGYVALSDIRINDATGAGFYAAYRGQEFNLPIGVYSLTGEIGLLPDPIPYEMTTYPIERDDRPYNRIRKNICDNPHKASVIFHNNIADIFIDKSIAALPLACVCYVIAHELAHSKYYGDNPKDLECKCDAHGEQRLIDLGWNPSQLQAANGILLQSGWRKSECEKRMQKHFAK